MAQIEQQIEKAAQNNDTKLIPIMKEVGKLLEKILETGVVS